MILVAGRIPEEVLIFLLFFKFKNPISDTKVGKIWEWGGNKIIASFDRNQINFVKEYTPLSSKGIDLPPIYCTKSAHYFGC